MQLPAQYLVQVIEHLQQVRTESVDAEMRRAPRYAIHSQVRIVPIAPTTQCVAITVLARSLAQGGIGLMQTRPAKVGLLFACGLPRPRGVPLLVLCSIRHAQTLADDVYGVGAEFIKIVGPEDAAYARLLAAIAAPTTDGSVAPSPGSNH